MTKPSLATVIFFVVGCRSHGLVGSVGCPEAAETVSAGDSSATGFAATDVYAALAEPRGLDVAWSGLDGSALADTVSVTLSARDEAVVLVERAGTADGRCPEESALEVPVEVAFTTASGLATGAGSLTVEAVGLEASGLRLDSALTVEVTLSAAGWAAVTPETAADPDATCDAWAWCGAAASFSGDLQSGTLAIDAEYGASATNPVLVLGAWTGTFVSSD